MLTCSIFVTDVIIPTPKGAYKKQGHSRLWNNKNRANTFRNASPACCNVRTIELSSSSSSSRLHSMLACLLCACEYSLCCRAPPMLTIVVVLYLHTKRTCDVIRYAAAHVDRVTGYSHSTTAVALLNDGYTLLSGGADGDIHRAAIQFTVSTSQGIENIIATLGLAGVASQQFEQAILHAT